MKKVIPTWLVVVIQCFTTSMVTVPRIFEVIVTEVVNETGSVGIPEALEAIIELF